MATNFSGLNATNNRLALLQADFSGMKNLDKIIDKTLKRLSMESRVQGNLALYKSGAMSREEFDGFFAELVRKELGKTLGIVRNKAIAKARQAGAGSAASAVLRRMYKSGKEGNINIGGNRGRISSRDRIVPPPSGGESGIRRERTVKDRTEQLRKYYGPDRSFVLRVLDGGRDVYYATPEGPTGPRSKATYGKRGAIGPRNFFFHQMQSDMELAAQQLGHTLIGAVEKWVEQQFTESTE